MELEILLCFNQIIDALKKTGNSKGLPEESIEPSTTFSDIFYPSSNYISNKTQLKFDESYLKQDVLNMYQTRCTKLH